MKGPRMTLEMLLFTLLVVGQSEARAPLSIRIGGVFESEDTGSETTLLNAAQYINNRQDTLNGTRLDTYLQYCESSYLSAYTVTCVELEQSVLSIFSNSPGYESIIGSLAFKYKIPHFSLDLVSGPTMLQNPFTVYLSPSREDITAGVVGTVLRLGAERVGVVTHSATGVLHSSSLVERLQVAGVEVLVVDLADKDVRPDLSQLRRKGLFTCVVDVGANLIPRFIHQAMQSGLVSTETTFLFTSLDFENINLELARYSGAMMLGFSVLDPAAKLNLSQSVAGLEVPSYKDALLIDAVNLFAKGVQQLSSLTDVEIPRVRCSNLTQVYTAGDQLLASFSTVVFNGLTGPVKLKGQTREEVVLRLLALDPNDGFQQVGVWSRDRRGSVLLGDIKENLNKLRLTGKEKLVLVSREPNPEVGSVLALVSTKFGASYRTVENYSQTEKDEIVLFWEYNTMTSTEQRPEGSGKSAIGAKSFKQDMSMEQDPSLEEDSFLEQDPSLDPDLSLDETVPISVSDIFLITKVEELVDYWISVLCLVLGILTCSVALSLTSRISPYQRRVAVYTFQDSVWITVSALLFKSWNFKLQGVSSRLVSVVWWIFSILSVLHLISFLNPPGTVSLEQILQDASYSFQTLEQSTLAKYLQMSPSPLERSLSTRLAPSFKTLSQALDQVSAQDKLALIVEGSQLEAVSCNYQKLKIGSRPISLFLRPNSIWRSRLNSAILSEHFQTKPENRFLQAQLDCKPGYSFKNIFYYGCGFVLCSCILSVLLAVLELISFSARRTAKSESFWRLFNQEIKLLLRGEAPDRTEHRSRCNLDCDDTPCRNRLHFSAPSFSDPTSPEKTSRIDLAEEPSVTDKLILQKELEDRFENSRL